MNIKNHSINYKTLSYLILFSSSILIILWVFQILFLRVFYEKYQIKTVNKISKEILSTKEDLNVELEEIAYQYDVCIEYKDINNNTISFNNKKPTCLLNQKNSDIKIYKYQLISKAQEISTLKLTNQEYEIKGLLSAVKLDKGTVFVYTDLEDVHSTTVVLKSQLIYITLITIIISCLIALFLSRRLTKPIVNITNEARKLSKGNYNVEFKKSGIREIDELADTLNYTKEELSKIDELRRDLMANVSHDLKTPLTMIKAYAEMIKDFSYKDEKKRNQHLNIIIDETDRLNVLVSDILLLSKTQARVEQLNIEEFDLIKEIKNVIKKYEIIKETEDYRIIYKGPKKAMIKADKKKINQVVYNLINNAINYTGKDKTVTVNVVEEEKKYCVQIIDTGKGIKKEDIKHIWDKYYKNEKNHQRNVVGTGLGLSIVKSILEQHNFKYGVTSILKKGTTFYFEINK